MLKRESSKGYEVDLAAFSRFGKHNGREYLSIDFQPIEWEEDLTLRTDVFLTSGAAYLRYVARKRGNGFRIVCFDKPFVRMSNIFMFDYDDFLHLCSKYKEFEFIRKLTQVDERWFDFARRNYGIYIPLAFDFMRYEQLCGGKTRFSTEQIMKIAADERLAIRMTKEQTIRYATGKKASKKDASTEKGADHDN